MVDAGLKRLYGFQHGDGGWGWWQSDDTNQWMSAYVVYGLSLGQEPRACRSTPRCWSAAART